MSCKEITESIKFNIQNKIVDYDLLKKGMHKLVDLCLEEHKKECINLNYNLIVYINNIKNDFFGNLNIKSWELYEDFNI